MENVNNILHDRNTVAPLYTLLKDEPKALGEDVRVLKIRWNASKNPGSKPVPEDAKRRYVVIQDFAPDFTVDTSESPDVAKQLAVFIVKELVTVAQDAAKRLIGDDANTPLVSTFSPDMFRVSQLLAAAQAGTAITKESIDDALEASPQTLANIDARAKQAGREVDKYRQAFAATLLELAGKYPKLSVQLMSKMLQILDESEAARNPVLRKLVEKLGEKIEELGDMKGL